MVIPVGQAGEVTSSVLFSPPSRTAGTEEARVGEPVRGGLEAIVEIREPRKQREKGNIALDQKSEIQGGPIH